MNEWNAIINAAFDEAFQSQTGAVAGAKFRQIVARKASDIGVSFPPNGIKRFSEFLALFPDQVLVQHIPGSDILVTRASEPERLSHKGSASRIRQDLFIALTQFDDNARSYYIP